MALMEAWFKKGIFTQNSMAKSYETGISIMNSAPSPSLLFTLISPPIRLYNIIIKRIINSDHSFGFMVRLTSRT